MELVLDEGAKGEAIVRLSGELTVADVLAVRQTFLKVLEESQEILVDLGAAETIDSYFLQLLCSAHRSCILNQKKLSFSNPPSASVQGIFALAGFVRNQGCSQCPANVKCLWSA